MRVPLLPRALRFQPLEARDLMAGDVLVRVLNGNFTVTGDALDNTVTIERVLDPASGAATLLVTPDATTRVNGAQAGVAVAVGDVNGDGLVDMKGGADTFSFLGGRAILKSFRCSPGTGQDQIVLQDFSVRGSLSIDNAGDADSFSLTRVRAGIQGQGSAAAAGSMVMKSAGVRSSVSMADCVVSQSSSKVNAIALENCDSSLDHCTVQGSGKSTSTLAGKVFAKVEFHDCLVSSWSITHKGGGADISAERTSFFDVFVDVDASLSPEQASHVVLSDSDLSGPLSLRIKGESSVALDDCAMFDAFLKLERLSSQSFGSSVSLSDTEFRRFSLENKGGVDVSSQRCAAVDFFLKLDGIKGELHRSSVAMSTAQMSHLSLRATEQCDVDLEQSSFFDVFCDIAQPPGSAVGAALQIKMSDLLVSSACSVSTRGGATDVDVGTSRFAACFLKFDGVDGEVETTKVSLHQVTSTSSITVVSRDQTDLSLDACKAVDISIKLDRVSKASPLLSSVVCSGSSATRKLSIESRGGIDTSLETCSAVDMFIKIDGIKGELHRSSTSLLTCASTHLLIASTEQNDVSVDRSSFFDVSCTISPLASPPNGATAMKVKMTDVLVSSFCLVSTSGESEIEVGSSQLGSLSVSSRGGGGGGGGAGKVSVHDISITKSCSITTVGAVELSVAHCSAVDMFLKMERTSLSAPVSTGDCDDLDLTGRFSLDSKGAVDFSITGSTGTDYTVKLTPLSLESVASKLYVADTSNNRLAVSSTMACDVEVERSSFFDLSCDISPASSSKEYIYHTIKLSNARVSNACTLGDISPSPDVSLVSSEFGSLSVAAIGSGAGAGKVNVHDISVMRALSISSSGETAIALDTCSAADIFMKVDRLSRTSSNASIRMSLCTVGNQLSLQGRGGVDVSVTGTEASAIYMKFDGIKGESHRQAVSLDDTTADSLSISSGEVQDFSLTRSAFFDVFCDVSVSSTSPPGAASDCTTELDQVRVDGSMTLQSNGASQIMNLRRCTCSAGYYVSGSPSGRSSALSISDSSFSSSLSIVTKGENDVTVDSCAASEIYMKFERLASGQPGVSSLEMSHCPVDNSLSVESLGSMDVAVDDCRMADFFMKIDAIKGERRVSSIGMSSSTASGTMSFSSTCPVTLTVIGSFADDMFIKLDRGVNSVVDGSRIVVEATDCDDRFTLSSSSGADVVLLNDLDVNGRSSVSLGAGDDRLSLTSCSLGLASLDGGLGFDQLSLVDSVFSNEQFSFNYEKITF